MNDFSNLIQQGASSAWLFMPSAILLGALHGLEPGHSKTMMAAFIVAIRGSIAQAILLGLSATVSHTLIVWIIALGGLYFGQQWGAETSEPYLQVASAALIIGVALWMAWRTYQDQKNTAAHANHHHEEETKHIDTGHGVLRLEIFEDGVPPRFRLFPTNVNTLTWSADEVRIETNRGKGEVQVFTFEQRDGYLQSVQEIPEPHEFLATLSLGHANHSHDFELQYVEHSHHHLVSDGSGLDVTSNEYQDARERAHANDIRRRFSNREVTTGQVVLFGLTGGLIPCPASITVLLLCLQLKEFTLGAAMVLCFSIGLAMTMVLSGVIAAWSVKHVSSRWNGFGSFAKKAPYISSVLIFIVGLYLGYTGMQGLIRRPPGFE